MQNWKVILAFACIYIVWGSTFLAALIGLNGLPPYLMISLRFFVAGLVLYAWSKMKGEANPDLSTVKSHSLSGILMLVGGTGSVVWAEQYIATGLAAIIVAALPIWFILLDRPQWKNYFYNKLVILGILLGFAGILVLFGFPKAGTAAPANHHMQLISIALITGGSIAWAAGSLYSRTIRSASSTIMTVSLQLLAAGICALLVSALLGELHHFSWSHVQHKAWMALLYMIVMGSIVTYVAYIWLLTVRPAVQVGTYAYVNPVIAVLLGWAFAGEPISVWQILSLLAIMSGVLLINMPNYKSASHD